MIEATKLSKTFDRFQAVREVSLSVGPGELLALLGPNGAGKTTTVRMLGAILRPTSGTATIQGLDVVRDATHVRRRIGMLTEQPGLYPRMSGLEYLTFYGRLYGLDDMEIRKRVLDLFEKFGMPGESQRRLGTFSKGMRQKVGLIRSMLHNPAVLLLDEPTSAMDPYSARLVRDAIQLLRRDQRSIILCTHNLAEAEELADRIALISHGQIVCIGTAAELKSEVLGKPQYELRLNRAIRLELGHLDSVADVEVLEDGAVIRYRTEKASTTNPLLVQRITELGAGILSLQQLPQSLEDVYLKMLRREAQEAPNGGRR